MILIAPPLVGSAFQIYLSDGMAFEGYYLRKDKSFSLRFPNIYITRR